VRSHRITLTLLDLADGRFDTLATHLRGQRSWVLVHFDGRFTLYARRRGPTSALSHERGFQLIQGTLELEYLAHAPKRSSGHLRAELSRLDREGPALARAISGYLELLRAGGPPPLLRRIDSGTGQDQRVGRLTRALQLLSSALPELPPSAALMSYLATAHARLGQRAQCDEVLRIARQLFPSAPHLLALELARARRDGDDRATKHWLSEIRRRGLEAHALVRRANAP
jgi:hypothetical protein